MGQRHRGFAIMVAIVSLALAACGGSSKAKEIPIPKGIPFTPEQQQQLHTIRDRVSELRREPVNRTLTESVLTRAELKQWFDAQKATISDNDRREIDKANTVWRLLHMIGPDDDVYQSSSDFYSSQIAGFYEPKSNALVLIADHGQISASDESVLAHEYVHSFQYGALNTKHLDELKKKQKDSDPTEFGTTTSCVTEGDATLAQAGYGVIYGLADQAEPPAAPADPGDSKPIPPAIEREAMFDYNECALFAAALFKDADRSWTKVNAAFDRPPSTTEQVMHPEKYLLGETPTSMKTLNIEKRLPGGWKQKDSSILGEFDLYNYLFSVGGDKDPAAKAAAGWGVGWVNIYDNAKTSDVLLHIQLEFDSAAELGQFVEYYRTVANKVAGKDVSSAAASGPICWNNDAEYGYFTYADGLPRADIVISTNQAARDAAAHGSLSAVTRGACTAT